MTAGKPRGIKAPPRPPLREGRLSPGEAGDRNPQELRINPRFLHLLSMEKAGQAAGYSSSRESGIIAAIHPIMKTTWIQPAHSAPAVV
jgi:hypothetical protein